MRFFPLFLFLLTASCQQTEKKGVTSFSGEAMTINYRILIGKYLNPLEEQKIKCIIEKSFAEVDQIYNKWNDQSEISYLNKLEGFQEKSLSPKLYKLLKLTDLIHNISKKFFDPTIEPFQKLWKRKLSQNQIPSEEMINSLKPAVSWDKIHFNQQIFWKEHHLTELDLSGIAKGYLVDLIVERLILAGFRNIYVEWGGEIRVFGKHPESRPWKVFISQLGDSDPNHAIDIVPLENMAIATSGDYEQYYKINNSEEKSSIFFHLIDPQTGKFLEKSKGSISSASVTAPTCAIADGLATALLLAGSKEAAYDLGFRLMLFIPNFQFWII